MPIYDYKCRDCSAVFEVFLRSEHGGVNACPSCRSFNVERMISGSYTVRMSTQSPGDTCCGRAERCDSPPCHTDHGCHRR
jgi:putative FmdB family regulatory protein